MESRSSHACSQKAPLSDRVIRSPSSLIADVNLQNGRFVSAGPHLEWDDFVASSAELLTDCLKTLQPVGVAVIYGDLKLYSPAQSFDSVRDAIASEPLGGQYKRPPANLAVFEDLSVALVFKQDQTHIHTMLGPMRRHELDPLIDGEPDLEAYPQTLLFVHRRYEIRPGGSPEKARFDPETGRDPSSSKVANAWATRLR